MKNENMLPQVSVPFLGDVGAEIRVAAIGVFDGVPSQHAGYQRISIRLAIRDQVNTLAGSAGSVAFDRSFVQRRARGAGRRHECRCWRR